MFHRVDNIRKPFKIDFYLRSFREKITFKKWQQLTDEKSAICISANFEFIQFENIDSKSIKKLFPLSSERQKFSDRNKNMIYDVSLLAFNKSAAFFIKMDDFS